MKIFYNIITFLVQICVITFVNGVPHDCSEKTFTKLELSFDEVQSIQKVAIIAPLGTYYILTSLTEGEDDDLVGVFMQNGQKMVVHSSLTANYIEWHTIDILVKRIKIVPIFDNGNSMKYHSPQLIINSCTYNTKLLYVDDQSYTVDSYNAGLVSMYENELVVTFRTFESGLFFFSLADQGDMLIAQIVNGHIEVLFDFGSLSKSVISGGIALNDGNWHEMKWIHQFDSVKLVIDGVLLNSTTPAGLYRKLDFNFEVEIGGRPYDQYSKDIQSSYHGCLAKVNLNNIDLLSYAPKDKFSECHMAKPQILTINDSDSSVYIPYSFMPFTFEFRMLRQTSNLITVLDGKNESLLSLAVQKNNSLYLIAEKNEIKQEFVPSFLISDGSWHSISIKMRNGRLNVEMNGLIVLWLEGSFVRTLGLSLTAFNLTGVGCFRSASVDFKNAVVFGKVHRDKCSYKEMCLPCPCQNKGVCSQTALDNFECSCPNGFSGKFCHTAMYPYSCEDHLQRLLLQTKKFQGIFGGFKSKLKLEPNVTIDIDGSGPNTPFQVECRFSNKTHPDQSESIETVLFHDLLQGMYVTGTTEPGSIRKVLNYGMSESTIEKFIDGFSSCKQFQRYQCRGGSKLMTYGNERRPSSWYATRNGQQGLQWADAPPYSRVCECAMNASCSFNRMCNCDSGRDGIDEGYNSHLQLLPVIQLYAGGTHKTSSVNISIGPLICSQKIAFDVVTFNDRNQRLVGSHTFNGPIFDLYLQVRFSHSLMTIFTWESKNSERWFQLFVREGYLVAQIVNGGRSQEVQSGLKINDDSWHTVYWEADLNTMKLVVDKEETSVSMYNILPWTYNYIIGSRNERGFSGFAGQMRNFYLCGKAINLSGLARKLHSNNGIKVGLEGFCKPHYCKNGGKCVEMYDNFKCNCSMTAFDGDRCNQERSAWIPLRSELSIPWQHPSQMSNCYRMGVQTHSTNVSLIKAKALFADSSFNLSITVEGNLNVSMYDGFFFLHQKIVKESNFSDNTMKDIHFCATKKAFELKVDDKVVLTFDGNFTFFSTFNVWNFVDHKFMGCVARLQIGASFPLKNPVETRLTYTSHVKFDVCPHEKLLYKETEQPDTSKKSDISISVVSESHQKMLILTPIIGVSIGSVLCILLCCFVCYVKNKPDGVYKTNEAMSGYCSGSPSKSAEYLMTNRSLPVPQNKEYFC